MIFHLSSVDKFRIDTIEEKDSFEDAVRQDGIEQGYIVKGFKYTEKNVKEKGDIIDTFYIVEVSKEFQDAKEPYKEFGAIIYKGATFRAGDLSFDE